MKCQLSLKLMFIGGLILHFSMFESNAQKAINEMFDDFIYSESNDILLKSFGWTVRTGNGGPGADGCKWSNDNISFIDDSTLIGNKFMRLSASSSGSGASTSQSEIYHKKIYFEGTYAARIFFTDEPIDGGEDGDAINETFFAISPLAANMDLDYSELDFVEYLPNGGWGVDGTNFWMTSWETYQAEPWIQDSKSNNINASFAGWHTVACVVANGKIDYYIDGENKASHSGKYYPEVSMSINFNLWFIGDGFTTNKNKRTYIEDIDWVYHAKDTVINPSLIPDIVNNFRNKSVLRKNNMNEVITSNSKIAFSKPTIRSYPNPASDFTDFLIELPKDCLLTMNITNALGQNTIRLVNAKLTTGEHRFRLDTSTFTPGIYYYRATIDNGEKILGRLIKM